jgi:hypothetical protein
MIRLLTTYFAEHFACEGLCLLNEIQAVVMMILLKI